MPSSWASWIDGLSWALAVFPSLTVVFHPEGRLPSRRSSSFQKVGRHGKKRPQRPSPANGFMKKSELSRYFYKNKNKFSFMKFLARKLLWYTKPRIAFCIFQNIFPEWNNCSVSFEYYYSLYPLYPHCWPQETSSNMENTNAFPHQKHHPSNE